MRTESITQHEKLRITLSDQVNEQWLDSLVDWFATQRVLNDDEVKLALAKWVPEYSDRKVDEQSALTEQKVEITG